MTDPTYYPAGNTPAAFLLQSLPPEQDATVLLMGAGDPRNILFTAYNVQDDGVWSDVRWIVLRGILMKYFLFLVSRSVDFTCCDIQPAILGLWEIIVL